MPLRTHLASLRTERSAAHAGELRTKMTDAEHRLWRHLRHRGFHGLKFRRQVPLGFYVVDFLCESQRLIVEVDGGQHAERAQRDECRTAWLRAHGYRVERFWNNE